MANSSSHDSGVCSMPFFDRCKLPATVKDDCDAFVRSRYSGSIRSAPFQGYCSYTLFVGEETAVQFRPFAYKLDIGMTRTACNIFKRLAPETEYLGQLEGTDLHAFSMRKLPGVSLADYRAMSSKTSAREQMVRDFAQLQALAWRKARRVEDLLGEKRTVGSSLTLRLELMSASLPIRFRGTASSILDDISEIEALPWCFTHGDFLAANIMVNPYSGRLTGLLDWAEAEWLPFGIGMYGLEELLGEDNQSGRFVYYSEATQLRNIFWEQLLLLIPELDRSSKTVAIVKKAQQLGVLLWHGIAFDDGNLNRVVEEGRDDREIQRLTVFLSL
ncbi:hypothetical protein E0Z10_g1342 [Xylaria hypoxylon]|uniref:Aminoglycoside phosphotransferase domain-containing protein n=1 Tax=Xylaria hypoxylon TaxID=37992 RepID=A0A4Z0ZF18_9PEZI|nr:hypothetical protein E0Z10_g1342 [Xylaria hypoxylon]